MLGRFGGLVPLVTQNVQLQQQQRGMATLKSISIRLKSVKNIQKITQSMKMVSAAKYSRAERELKQTRPIGSGAAQFYEKAEIAAPEDLPQKLLIAITSDRGTDWNTILKINLKFGFRSLWGCSYQCCSSYSQRIK